MAQGKGKAAKKGGPINKHIHSRISYLYQAATYLEENARSRQANTTGLPNNKTLHEDNSKPDCGHSIPVLESSRKEDPARNSVCDENERLDDSEQDTYRFYRHHPSSYMLNHLRAVTRRSQIRITPNVKQSICKRCDALLITGTTATKFLENKSRNGKKAWADVIVVTCLACGTSKRFPSRANRQPKRQKRITAKAKICIKETQIGGAI